MGAKGHRGESRYSPRRLEAMKREQQALELRMAGRTWLEISLALGYADNSGPIRAVEGLLKRTLTPTVEHWRALSAERLSKILEVFWPRMVGGDEGAGKICLRAVSDLRALFGTDAPIKVQVDIQEEARRIAREMGLPEDEIDKVVREAEKLLKAGAKWLGGP